MWIVFFPAIFLGTQCDLCYCRFRAFFFSLPTFIILLKNFLCSFVSFPCWNISTMCVSGIHFHLPHLWSLSLSFSILLPSCIKKSMSLHFRYVYVFAAFNLFHFYSGLLCPLSDFTTLLFPNMCILCLSFASFIPFLLLILHNIYATIIPQILE